MGFDLRHFREVITEVGASATAIAKIIGCSRGTVYAYLRKYPELKAAFEQARGAAVADQAQFSKEAFEKAIKDSYGVKAAVAAAVGCSRQTVDNALERWPELREQLDAARSGLVAKATSALAADVDDKGSDGHLRAYMFVLRTLGKDEGFVERNEVTGADGAGLFDLSPEVAAMVKEMGLDASEVVRQFEAMVRAVAAEKKAE
jgi:AcrR family transcriptional regulator